MKLIMSYIAVLAVVTVLAMLTPTPAHAQSKPVNQSSTGPCSGNSVGNGNTTNCEPAADFAAAQIQKGTPKPDAKPTEPPQLTGEEKAAIFLAQRNQAAIAIQEKDAELNYTKLQAAGQAATQAYQQALASAQKRIGDTWKIDPDTLTVTAPPPMPAAKPQK